MEVESRLDVWEEKIQQRMDWSNFVGQLEEFKSFIDNSRRIFTKAMFNDV